MPSALASVNITLKILFFLASPPTSNYATPSLFKQWIIHGGERLETYNLSPYITLGLKPNDNKKLNFYWFWLLDILYGYVKYAASRLR